MCSSFRKDIFDHRDINWFSFLNNGSIFFMINIYSDKHQLAINYLKDIEANIWYVLIMARNFNIRDRKWNPSYSFYLSHNNSLMKVTNSFELKLSSLIYQIPTCYTNNPNNSNSIIDLIFLWPNLVEINNYFILPEFWHSLDYTPLIVNISIIKEFIQEK